jgi:hypothetical protein
MLRHGIFADRIDFYHRFILKVEDSGKSTEDHFDLIEQSYAFDGACHVVLEGVHDFQRHEYFRKS